ncbi:MarR family transcriptional regulator [Moraxella caviae]|uniref:MarR family transcriptional regulator n=1 Tax=Moraxella caviae TaxID=34060 RepID=A0A1T0AD02_9GAMM|nr:MarR family transcriptional regulator [Moraxella caviae]OOR93181.1 MarR family transcriptional regulator [Moraxella caviae]STZ10451.1 Organic hydroperoxide resistance transcriptional regulator [Moraxella caviae]
MQDNLKLSNQLCFPLYSLSRIITSAYRPLLDELDLTYPQYLVLLVLWEHGQMSVGGIGEKLLLDSGTLTPLLKRLEAKGMITRERSQTDERTVLISLTESGKALQEEAYHIPSKLADELGEIGQTEVKAIKDLFQKLSKKQ